MRHHQRARNDSARAIGCPNESQYRQNQPGLQQQRKKSQGNIDVRYIYTQSVYDPIDCRQKESPLRKKDVKLATREPLPK
ncbi:hypothetical protein D3C87_1396160 [compost metagenome]